MEYGPVIPKLLEFYNKEAERVGFVLKSGEIVEVDNVCEKTEEGFEVKGEDLVKYEDEIAATWHTHPAVASNLSTNDYYAFRSWPDFDHLIIGNEGVSLYQIVDGQVLQGTMWPNAD